MIAKMFLCVTVRKKSTNKITVMLTFLRVKLSTNWINCVCDYVCMYVCMCVCVCFATINLPDKLFIPNRRKMLDDNI